MATIQLEAEVRTDIGKGASRRLRRLESKVPGIVYGGDKKPQTIYLLNKHVSKALEQESIYSSVFDLSIAGKVERVILKAIQRHPYRPIILHMDLQRVSAKDILVKMIPLHFINEEDAPGVQEGGVINHAMVHVEVRCQAQDLPEFIEVDVGSLELNGMIHLSEIKLPKGVKLAHAVKEDADHTVVSIHLPRAEVIEEPEEEVVEGEEGAEGEAAEGEEGAEGTEEAAEGSDESESEEEE